MRTETPINVEPWLEAKHVSPTTNKVPEVRNIETMEAIQDVVELEKLELDVTDFALTISMDSLNDFRPLPKTSTVLYE